MIDSRVHFLNQNQWSSSISKITEKFEKSNVVASMITGMPVIWSNERNKFYWYPETDNYLAEMLYLQPTRIKTNFYPFISCAYDAPQSVNHVNNMLEDFPDFWRGIGPIFMSHRYDSVGNGVSLFKIIDIAEKNNFPVHIYYEFNDIETEPIEGGTNYLESIQEMERDDKDITLFKILERFPNTKFILYFKSYMPITKAKSINKLLSSMLSKYPNLTIDLSGKLLENIYMNQQQQMKTQKEEKLFLEDVPDIKMNQQAIKISREINSIEDLGKIVFGLIDDFLSGEPLKKHEKGDMKLTKNIGKGIDMLDDGLDKVGDFIGKLDPVKSANNFLKPRNKKNVKDTEKELAKLGVAGMLNKNKANMLYAMEQKNFQDDIDLVPKGRIHQDWSLNAPPAPIGREQIPKELNANQRREIKKRIGNNLVSEIDDENSGKIESRIKDKSTGALLPIIAFEDDFKYLERFSNPKTIEGFGMFNDFTGIVKDTAKNSVTLPKNVSGKPPPPLTKEDLRKNKNILPPIKFSNKSKKLFKDVNNYIDSGEFEGDIKKGVKKGAQNFLGIDEFGRTIYERPHRGRDGRVYYITEVVTIGEDKYIDVIDIVTRKRRRYFKNLEDVFPEFETSGIDPDDMQDNSLRDIYIRDNDDKKERERVNKELTGDDLYRNKIDYTKKQLGSLFGVTNENQEVNDHLNKNKYQINKFEQIRNDWIKLIEHFPEQFIIGTGIVANFDNYNDKLILCNKLLGDLSPSTSVKVSKINFIKLVS